MKRIIGLWAVVLFMGLMVFTPAQAENKPASSADKQVLEKTSKIERVTVYQDRALVTRQVNLDDLQPGIYEVVLKALPVRIQDESVRAATLDSIRVKILDVKVKTYQLEKAPEEKIRALQDQIQDLSDKLRTIGDTMRILQTEKSYLNATQVAFFKTAVQPVTIIREGGKEEKLMPRLSTDDYDAMLLFLTAKLSDNNKAIQAEEIKKRDINKKIIFLQGELNKMGVRHSAIPRQKSVKVTFEALKACSTLLEVSYINYSVTWKPSYDIRVLEKDKKMQVIGYGVVSQNSGEDWTDVKLSFSTAQPALRGWLPELKPLYVTLPNLVPRQTYAADNYAKGVDVWASNESILSNQGYYLQNETDIRNYIQADTQMAPEVSAYLAGNAVARFGSVVFHTPKRTDIMSDNAPHRTAILEKEFPIKFEYITCPKTSPHVYLKVLGTNTMDAPFLRGTLNVFMGSDFVGSSITSGILPTEEFELTLSVDENIRVSRKLESKEEKGPGFFGSRKKISYAFLIKLENYKKEDVIVNVVDQLPVSQTEDVTIEKGVFSDKPEKEEKDGKLKWRFVLKPKETKKLTFSFNVYVPKDKPPAFYNKTLPALPQWDATGTKNFLMEMKKVTK